MTEFTLDNYRKLLKNFQSAGYSAVRFADVDPMSRHIILRHDVDFCPAYCLPIAELEADLNISTTFYFLVSSSFYNVLEAGTQKCIRRIIELGHVADLHFDVAACGTDMKEAERIADVEARVLAHVTGQTVESISFHRPIKALVGYASDFAGRMHTYQPRFVRDIAYYSDSRGGWHHGHPLDSKAFREGTAIQLLTHPIWWYLIASEAPSDRLMRCLADLGRKSQQVAARNTTVF